jgi:phosphoesterase RecJ-like protein
VFTDPTAAATGELVYDLLLTVGGPGEEWPIPVAEAIYTAIISDTGSFRYANTTPRTHRIAAELIERGVDPEAVYRRIYATMPLRRIELLRASLEHLVADPLLPVTWITVPREVVEELSATSEDMDGIVEYARSIEGTEVALLFREVPDGSTKISFRSNGEVDVNALARQFGGGGHVKAAGAVIGAPLRSAREEVLEAVRNLLRELEMTREPR